ncbi:MAG: xanthine dehydrogenase family protein, partial [Firmicutes bacterium]|nr:xanthine dehydrogenase family protein [Bacillota bacterium]
NTLHLALVMPHTDHANILSVDTSEAETMPGVVKVITARDVQGTNAASQPQTHPRAASDGIFKPILCDKKIFRYGDVVAVVAAHSRQEARAAAKKVCVQLEELPAYMTALASLHPEALQIHEETPNRFCMSRLQKGQDTRDVFPTAAHVVSGSFYTSSQPHLPIESDVYEAYLDEEERVTIQCKSQALFGQIDQIAAGVGLPKEKLRIIDNTVGGSFGYTMNPTGPAIMAVCEMTLRQPLVLEMSYDEHMAFSGKRTASYTNARLACDDDGKIIGLEYHMVLDSGAYPVISTKVMDKCCRFIGYPYNVPHADAVLQAVLSNHSFGIQYRGFGSPQSYMTSESLMDMMAEELGMDPFEFRYKNIARPGDLTVNSYPYRDYPMQEMMDTLRPYYQEAKARAAALSTDKKKRGVGLAWGGYAVSSDVDAAEVELELNPDGGVTHYNSWEQMGQGADIGTLTHTVEALLPLGIKPEQVRLVQNDTALVPNTGPAAGSRSHYMVGKATIDAANRLMAAMRKPGGTYRTYAEMMGEGIPVRYKGRCSTADLVVSNNTDTCQGNPSPAYNYLLTLVEVEVDMDTFRPQVLSVKAVSDVGRVGNLLAVEGQAYGGFSHALGFALSEDYADKKKHSSLLGAGIPQIRDVPDDMEFIFHQGERDSGPHGSSGCSEGFQSAGHAAILNAINNAIGVRIYELPARPEKIKAAYEQQQSGHKLHPIPYDFAADMHELFDYIAQNPISKN